MGRRDRQRTNGSYGIERLALDAGGTEPSAALRERILEGARTTRQEHRPTDRHPAWALAAVGVLASVGVAVWALSLGRTLEHTRSAQKTTLGAVALLARPDTRRLPLHGANGLLAVDDRTSRGVLVVNGLPRARAGKTYEAWLLRSGLPAAAGLFRGGGELSVVLLTRRVPPGSIIAVSLERAGGALQPHSPLVFAAARRF